ncbi:MAG TPA: PASTA domain-containing protein [Thermoleophilia bacterium]|nr:PASTA domain-containing protein [Thermoleophilia bacterium]
MTNGSQLGYRVVGELSRGDALRSERAVADDGSEIALKEVAPHDVKRFFEEMAAVARVDDPHLERVVSWGTRGEHAYVATELVPGTDLAQDIASSAPLPAATVEAYGAQVAAALAALHRSGVVHGGLKPSTIVVTPPGSLKLVDTGLARAQGSPDLTEADPPDAAWYLSPEDVMAQPLTPASDVYSLGVVLYEIATGRLPFDGHNAFRVAEAHVDSAVTAPHLVNPAVPESLENVILRCLSKAPQDRYATGVELLQALERALEGQAVRAAPVSVAAQKKRPLWPWIVVAVVAVAVVLALLWVGGVFSQSVTVPDVSGLTVSEANTKLTDAGLRLGTVTYESSPEAAQGEILSQTPKSGSSVDKGSSVDVVAAGVATKAVPNVFGLRQSEATAAITDAGFAVGAIAAVYDDNAPQGQVIDQAPAAGTQLLPGSQVAITVSRGPAPSASPQASAVPDVVGQTQDDAVSALQDAGFTVVVEKVPDASATAGTVTDQTPSAGVVAQPGSNVTIMVAEPVAASPSP